MGSDNSNHKIIGSVAKAMEILNLLYKQESGIGATEIARELDVSVGAAHHLLYTLKQYQFVEQNAATKKYALGIRLAIMGDRVKSISYLVDLCRPYMKELVQGTNETVNLTVLKDGHVVYVAQETGSKLIRMFTELGACVDAHCCGAGKILLSGLRDEEIQDIVGKSGLNIYTQNTITDMDKLFQSLNDARALGFALDDEEREEGVMCIAAPVKDYTGKIVAAISISGPVLRLKEKKEEYIKNLTDVCIKISQALSGSTAETV